MNKVEIIKVISHKMGIPSAESKKKLEELINFIIITVKEKDELKLHNIGKLKAYSTEEQYKYKKEQCENSFINGKTRRFVVFYPSRHIKRIINQDEIK